MDCPKCGETDLYRDEVDVEVGIIYGPYGCICGWSESPEYDRSEGPSPQQLKLGDEWYVDSTGGMQRVSAIADHCERFGLDRKVVEDAFKDKDHS